MAWLALVVALVPVVAVARWAVAACNRLVWQRNRVRRAGYFEAADAEGRPVQVRF